MTDNPYQTPSSGVAQNEFVGDTQPRRVEIRGFSRLSDAKALMGEQYLLFVGMCFVALIINSIVPFNLLMGPLACGLHLCFTDRARGKVTTFDQMFKGFDFFGQSFIATLLMMLFAFLLMIPIVLVIFIVVGLLVATAGGNEDFIGAAMLIGFIPLWIGILCLSIFIYMPFLFAFALIVDQRLPAWDAIKTSWSGVRKNFWGIFGMLILFGLIGLVCALMCYIPVFFVIPLQIGAFYLVYRDIFPNASDAYPTGESPFA